MIRETVTALPVPEPRAFDLSGVDRDVAGHDAHMARIPGLNLIETAGRGPEAPLTLPFTLGAWNLERCLFPEAAAARLADCDVMLVTEMDHGMARTGQRNTIRDMADARGMFYAFVAEYLELGLGSPSERRFCTADHNAEGYHGNGLIAGTAPGAPFALRLHGHRQWFGDDEQPRIGERVAIGARLETEGGPLVVVSTHLESACGPELREEQMRGLIASLDAEWPDMPLLIAGDLNTGNHNAGRWREEGLFDVARAAGFTAHGGPEDQPTTRASLITRFPERAMKLDWMLTRGLSLGAVEIRPALDPEGGPLSDHDALVARVEGFEP